MPPQPRRGFGPGTGDEMMNVYYAETDFGCCLVEAESEKAAIAEVRGDVGRDSFRLCRLATLQEIEWVRMMGGRVQRPNGQ
jgi:hypothetical protein